MKVQVTLVNSEKFILDLEENNLTSIQSFDEALEFAPQKVVVDSNGYRIKLQNVLYYKGAE